VSNLANNDPMLAANKSLNAEVDAACRNWAVKDLDCPAKGCFGFSFTLDKNFKLDGLGQAARLTPTKFPPWTTRFVRTTTPPDNKSQPDKNMPAASLSAYDPTTT
jgi:hypothetical protein